MPYAAQAPFNSRDKEHEPLCLPDTRIGVLGEIERWADGNDKRCIFWLNGLAGTGKSTIARNIARKYYDKKRLGASYFFSKGGEDTSNSTRFVTSLAVQLARLSPDLESSICNAIKEHPHIASQTLLDQWNRLILQPLASLGCNFPHPSLLLVVDALDECEGDNDVEVIIQLLRQVQSLEAVCLRILLTSRPEILIRIMDSVRHDFVKQKPTPRSLYYTVCHQRL